MRPRRPPWTRLPPPKTKRAPPPTGLILTFFFQNPPLLLRSALLESLCWCHCRKVLTFPFFFVEARKNKSSLRSWLARSRGRSIEGEATINAIGGVGGARARGTGRGFGFRLGSRSATVRTARTHSTAGVDSTMAPQQPTSEPLGPQSVIVSEEKYVHPRSELRVETGTHKVRPTHKQHASSEDRTRDLRMSPLLGAGPSLSLLLSLCFSDRQHNFCRCRRASILAPVPPVSCLGSSGRAQRCARGPPFCERHGGRGTATSTPWWRTCSERGPKATRERGTIECC